jgi:hypothetical protein
MKALMIRTKIIVTYPNGTCKAEPVNLTYKPDQDLYEFEPTGDNPLKKYLFGLVGSQLTAVQTQGAVVDVDR